LLRVGDWSGGAAASYNRFSFIYYRNKAQLPAVEWGPPRIRPPQGLLAVPETLRKPKKDMHRYKRLLAVAAFLGLLFVVFQLSGLRDNFSLAYLHQKFLDNEASGLLIFIVLFALGNLIQIPGWIFLAASVLALGPVWGGVATYIAAVISCVFTFWVIRLVGGDALRQLNGKWATRVLARLDARPITSIVILRILLQTVPALNYALAMSGVKFRSYLIGTLLGLPLPIVLYCVFFEYLAKALHIAVY
jgi:uncharacterized membrane protein YdjX (TVP38/TMEM64 family)